MGMKKRFGRSENSSTEKENIAINDCVGDVKKKIDPIVFRSLKELGTSIGT